MKKILLAIVFMLVASLVTAGGTGVCQIYPAVMTKGQVPVVQCFYGANGSAWASGLLELDVPAGYPAPSLTPGVGAINVTLNNGTMGGITINGQAIDISITAMDANYGKVEVDYNYGNATPVQTPVGSGSYTWIYQSNRLSLTPSALTPLATQMVQTVLSPTVTPTITFTSTPVATATPDNNVPVTVTGAELISSHPCYLRAVIPVSTVVGVIHICNTNTMAGIIPSNVIATIPKVGRAHV